MGCTTSNPITNLNSITEIKSLHQHMSNYYKPENIQLKPDQIETIINTWNKIEDLKEFGLVIMTR